MEKESSTGAEFRRDRSRAQNGLTNAKLRQSDSALCRNLFRRTVVEQDLSAELAQAFEFLVETKIRDGTSTSDARRLAAIELGGVEQLKEEIREFRASYNLEGLLRRLRYGVRMLLKHKGFSAVAIIALGLGIGANTAIFSLVNGVLLRPLPFPNADRIIYFEGKNPAAGITDSNISYLDFTDWSQQTDLFASTAAYWTGNADLSGDGAEPEAVPRAGVTIGFFSVLGVQPVLGRAFVPEDDKPATFNEGRVPSRSSVMACGSAASDPTRRSSGGWSR